MVMRRGPGWSCSSYTSLPAPGAGQDLQDLPSGEPAPFAGCYDLQVGPWSSDGRLTDDSLFLAPPPRIELRIDPSIVRVAPGFRLAPAPGSLPSVHPNASWVPVGDEGVDLRWTSGFSGLRMELEMRGEGFEGEVRTFYDARPHPLESAPVTATRVPCEAPLPAEHRFRYEHLRGVALEEGDSIRLGEPLPSAGLIPMERDGGTYRVDGALAPPFADAYQALVSVTEAGLVRRIALHFGAEVDHGELRDRLVPLTGEPTSFTVRQMGDGSEGRWAIWRSRVSEIWLVAAGAEAFPPVELHFNLTRGLAEGQ